MLAAGKGSRMKDDLPKVLHPFRGKPLLAHVLENLKKAKINDIVVVIGYQGEMVQQTIQEKVEYVWQEKQLGTGHAVLQAKKALENFTGSVLVTCGDVPLIKAETYSLLGQEISKEKVKAVVLTMKLENSSGYGRILKDQSNSFLKIVEEKDASPEEKKVTEVNTGLYIFEKDFLFKGLKEIDCQNAQQEYYLPDVLQNIRQKGFLVKTLLLDNPLEGKGINTKEDLLNLERDL